MNALVMQVGPGLENISAEEAPVSGHSARMLQLIREHNQAGMVKSLDPFSRLEGALAVHCRVDLESRTVVEAASMATMFKGYEALLPGRDLHKVGLVSSVASGICGGVHATASALCLEMALGMRPPALGIVLRNLLLSCQYLNDNCMHLFVLAGPDYSQEVIEASNPEIWQRARNSICRWQARHGFAKVADLMLALNKGVGALYCEALQMVSLARQAYILLGGKYPHSESIVPGGVTVVVDAEKLERFRILLGAFVEFCDRTAAIWDEVFDFMLVANPRYEEVGRSDANMLDFGQWDHPDHYDGTYAECDTWGSMRWATPGLVLNGKLECSRLSLLNAGMEEFLDHSFQQRLAPLNGQLISHDPNGNPLSRHHPWNKRTGVPGEFAAQAYSWGSSLTCRGHGFEVGAYARLYLTALARQSPSNQFVSATGSALRFHLPRRDGGSVDLHWPVPPVWNAFERNRARAYSLAFTLAVTLENIQLASGLLKSGELLTRAPFAVAAGGRRLGVGLWGASRGFLAHWAVIDDGVIDNYQIAIPSRINVGTCTPSGTPGPLEQALRNTPVIESAFRSAEDFAAIDISRTIQSFDPCMSCSAHVLIDPGQSVRVIPIDTRFPV